MDKLDFIFLFLMMAVLSIAFMIGGYTSKQDIVKKHKASISYNNTLTLKEHHGSN